VIVSVFAGSSIINSGKITSTGTLSSTISFTGLAAYYDATDPNSWVDGSSTLYDISGNSAHLTAYGGVTTSQFNSAHGWNFNSDGKYFQGTCNNILSKNATIEAWLYPASTEVTSGDRGTVVLINGGSAIYMSWNKSNQLMSNYWYSHSPDGYHETGSASPRSAWNYWCSVWDYGHGRLYQYANNSVTSIATSGNANPGSTLNIGRESSGRQYSGGIAVIRIYHRALDPDEVFDHYYTERLRFGV